MAVLRTSFRGGPRSGKAFDRIENRLKRPLVDPVGKRVVEVMRFGPGSVADQRRRQLYLSASGGVQPWPRSKAFGNRPAPARSLHRTGNLDAQWAGRAAGSFEAIKPDRVQIGIQGYGAVHQRERSTTVRARRRGKTGRLSMQVTLGLTFGAWISARKLLAGLVIPPRRVGVSPEMLRRAAEVVVRGLVQ
jgi:hypothetical protein